MNILQKIFKEHYEEMIYLQHPRDSVIENVDKMINCGNPSFGGAMYGCGHCGNLKFVPFRCKSRFCPTCGNKYSIDRTTSMSFKIIKTPHRHCVFTIAEELRPFFLKDRSLLNCLFSAVCFSRSINLSVLPLVLSVSFTLLDVILNGIPTFTVFSLKAVLEPLYPGARLTILTTGSFVILFRPLF